MAIDNILEDGVYIPELKICVAQDGVGLWHFKLPGPSLPFGWVKVPEDQQEHITKRVEELCR